MVYNQQRITLDPSAIAVKNPTLLWLAETTLVRKVNIYEGWKFTTLGQSTEEGEGRVKVCNFE